jgi:hypothetical protein
MPAATTGSARGAETVISRQRKRGVPGVGRLGTKPSLRPGGSK